MPYNNLHLNIEGFFISEPYKGLFHGVSGIVFVLTFYGTLLNDDKIVQIQNSAGTYL